MLRDHPSWRPVPQASSASGGPEYLLGKNDPNQETKRYSWVQYLMHTDNCLQSPFKKSFKSTGTSHSLTRSPPLSPPQQTAFLSLPKMHFSSLPLLSLLGAAAAIPAPLSVHRLKEAQEQAATISWAVTNWNAGCNTNSTCTYSEIFHLPPRPKKEEPRRSLTPMLQIKRLLY